MLTRKHHVTFQMHFPVFPQISYLNSAFGWNMGHTKNQLFKINLRMSSLGGQGSMHLLCHYPFIVPLIRNYLPGSIQSRRIEGFVDFLNFEKGLYNTVNYAMKGEVTLKRTEAQRTFFKEILSSFY